VLEKNLKTLRDMMEWLDITSVNVKEIISSPSSQILSRRDLRLPEIWQDWGSKNLDLIGLMLRNRHWTLVYNPHKQEDFVLFYSHDNDYHTSKVIDEKRAELPIDVEVVEMMIDSLMPAYRQKYLESMVPDPAAFFSKKKVENGELWVPIAESGLSN
jgi:hypothetical protein